jgi:hypothetical protein
MEKVITENSPLDIKVEMAKLAVKYFLQIKKDGEASIIDAIIRASYHWYNEALSKDKMEPYEIWNIIDDDKKCWVKEQDTDNRLKWVKASERLPDFTGLYYCRYFNEQGDIVMKERTLYEDGTFHEDYELNQIEWLDESALQKNEQDTDVEKLAEEREAIISLLIELREAYVFEINEDGERKRTIIELLELWRRVGKVID